MVFLFFMYVLFQGFSPDGMPSLNYLNLRGNSLDDHSISDLRKLLKAFTNLHELEVSLIKKSLYFMIIDPHG